mmetsp:Transcript_26450/g.79331  ORF Transcript_26450/g.79331 Transcript_26450/m.79331 type:complete len:284 (+) Transcript_26450:226-1077(+)
MRLLTLFMASLAPNAQPPVDFAKMAPDPTKDVARGQTHHPSALRNRVPILKAMLKLLPDSDSWTGDALEVATGTGALLEVLAPAYPKLSWLPSEYVPEEAAAPDEQWSKHGKIGLREGLDELANIDDKLSVFKNCRPAAAVDLSLPWWCGVDDERRGSYSLIVCANTLHITPWACAEGLFEGAGEVLGDGGRLVLYGPFKVGGAFAGPEGGKSNAAFDAKLRATNEAWGIRDVEELAALAEARGLELLDRVDMPANNFLLHFVKGGGSRMRRIAQFISCVSPF